MHLPPVPGIVVPQQAFSPPSAVVPTLREPIRFSTQENAGVNLQNAGIPSYRGLINGDQPVSLESNVLSIHIHVRKPVVLVKQEMLICTFPFYF